jgi:hypothetical protein
MNWCKSFSPIEIIQTLRRWTDDDELRHWFILDEKNDCLSFSQNYPSRNMENWCGNSFSRKGTHFWENELNLGRENRCTELKGRSQ